jgi:ribosomal protein S18 acetylase RimI-like enzyme
MNISYRVASTEDLLGIGQVYLRAFPESLRDLRSPDLSARAVADVAAACLAAEPECVVVAEAHEQVKPIVAYVIAPSDTSKPWRAAVRRGLPLTWLWGLITGRYRLRLSAVMELLGDKLQFWDAARHPGAACKAAVLSLAVDPAWQGRGIGRRLLATALERLRALGAPRVRLEVRPDNLVARRLYESVGFRRVGDYADSRGAWDIMLLDMIAAEDRA